MRIMEEAMERGMASSLRSESGIAVVGTEGEEELERGGASAILA